MVSGLYVMKRPREAGPLLGLVKLEARLLVVFCSSC